VPVYVTTIVTALFVAGLVGSIILASARVSLAPLGFTAPDFLSGAVWQLLTFPFIDIPNFFTPLGIFCFYSWALEVEKHLGRGRFVKLLAAIVLVLPSVALSWWIFGITPPRPISGNYEVVAAVLIAFATLYPNIEYIGWIPLKWFAFACVAFGSLMYFPERNWIELSLLWAACATSFAFVRFIQRGGSMELPNLGRWFRRQPQFRVLPAPVSRTRKRDADRQSMDEVDALLDKIATSGMSSLTAKERATLEKARETLIKREPGAR